MGAETELPLAATQGTKLNMGSENANDSEFPVGLRVLVVDDDRICLLILDRMLRQCLYKVRTCERAVDALKILRENKDGFDVVISDVHMPDMDGFKLLELVGLEMDLPVIMMSANGETSAVMKGIKHGACDYLLKPVRIEELKNIWQHVVRRKKKDSDNLDDRQRPDDDGDNLASDGFDGASKNSKKRKDAQEEEDDTELENEDPSTSKKPRVVWTVDLHQKFVTAVNQLGIDKAVPKRILELMDVRALTRENVASHLQKYRLYLKRISGVAHQSAGGLGSTFFGATDERFIGGGLGDFRAHLSPRALVSSLQAGLLDRAGSNSPDPYLLGQIAAIHGINNGSVVRPPYGSALLNTPGVLNSAISSGLDFKQLGHGTGQLAPFGQPDRGPSGLSALQLSVGATMGRLVGHDNHFPADNSNNSLLMQMLQQKTSSQMPSGMLSDTSTSGQLMVSGDVGVRLSKINSSLNMVGSHLRPGQEPTLSTPSFEPSNGLASFRRTMGVDARPYNNASHVGIYNNLSTSSMLSPSISHGSELSILVSGKRGLICNAGEGINPSLEAVSSDHVLSGGNPASRSGMGLNNWHNWHGVGLSQDVVSILSSQYTQGSATGQASKVDCPQEQRLGWVTKFQNDLVADTDLKPLVTTTVAFCNEQGFGEKAPFELLLGSKAENGMISEPFSSSDDLLTSYIKQQQQEVMGLTEGDLEAEGYSLGNMYVK